MIHHDGKWTLGMLVGLPVGIFFTILTILFTAWSTYAAILYYRTRVFRNGYWHSADGEPDDLSTMRRHPMRHHQGRR